ncbi:MAG: septum formation initiator family protein [Minisyncoccales bacterium]
MRKKNKKERNLFLLILGLIFFTILIFFLTISNLKLIKKREELRKEISRQGKEIEYLEKTNQSLKAGISKLKEQDYWEEVAREQGYQRPGEKQVVILPPEEKGVKEKTKNFFENFLEWIKNEFKK